MQNFVLQFQSQNELKEIWTKSLSHGMLFLPSPNSYALHSDLHLVLKAQDGSYGVLLPARVIQILNSGGPQGKGMVVELTSFANYKNDLSSIINSLEKSPWKGLRDFSKTDLSSKKPAQPIKMLSSKGSVSILEEARQTLQRGKIANYYDLLGVDIAAGRKEIRQAYFNLTKKFHPDGYKGNLSEKDLQLIEAAFQKISFAYGVLRNPKKKEKYDFSKGKMVRSRDESKKDFQTKKIKLAHKEVRQKFGENIEKAKRIFEQALIAEENGDKRGARASIKIAITLDPLNKMYKKKLEGLK